jgi:hypothetical protein
MCTTDAFQGFMKMTHFPTVALAVSLSNESVTVPVYAKSTIAFTPAQLSSCNSITRDWLSTISLLNKACRCGETVARMTRCVATLRSPTVRTTSVSLRAV